MASETEQPPVGDDDDNNDGDGDGDGSGDGDATVLGATGL
jgi:hypothetical protein